MVRSFPGNGRKHSGTSSSRQRHDHARRQCSTAAIASFALAAEPGVGHQPQDRRKVAQARDCRGYEDWADGTALGGSIRFRGGDGLGIPAAHSPAAGRLSLCSATLGPVPDSISASSVPAAKWHLTSAGCGRRQALAAEVQAPPHRLLPHRHCRGADCRVQALSLRGTRPDVHVRRRSPRCHRR